MADPILITDDAVVQATLLRAGQTIPTPTPPFTKSITYFRHTLAGVLYYCLASYEYGHGRAADNGYTLVGLPACDFTPAQAAEWFGELVRDTSFGKIHTSEVAIDFTAN